MRERVKSVFKKSFTGQSFLSFLRGGEHNIQDHEYVKFFKAWQYTAITTLADSVMALPFHLVNNKFEEIAHEYKELITPELLQNIVMFMQLTGTAYVWKVMNGKKILGLNILLPQYLTAKIDLNGSLLGWRYSANGKSISFTPEEIIVFANINPEQAYPYITRGYSPLQAIAMTIRGEKEIKDWNYALLTNDVPPGTVLMTEQALSPDQIESIKKSRVTNHTGAKNVGKMAILPFGIKPVNIQTSPKEMEFVAQQAWDRDEILSIYKVPKAVIGLGDGVNVGNVKAFNQIYATRALFPLATKIARVLTKAVFDGIGTFEFINILPTDDEELRDHYFAGGITRNEYRQELGYAPIEGGDVFSDGSEAKQKEEKKSGNNQDSLLFKGIDFEKIVKENIKRSEERMQKRWIQKQKKNSEYEKQMKQGLGKIFTKQREDCIKSIEKETKDIKDFSFSLDGKYYTLYYVYLRDIAERILKQEGLRAMSELDIDIEFNPNSPELQKALKKKILQIAKTVDSATDAKLGKIISQSVNGGLTPQEIRKEIEKVFVELEGRRAETIVRTETIRFGTFAEQSAREQSGVVKYKQRWTAVDERVCEYCGKMHGKKVALQESFFSQGSTMTGSNGGMLKLDYEEVIGSPLHPNCRCDMIPLIE